MAKRVANARKSLKAGKKAGDKRGKNPNSLANLEAHKFKPGESGNPGGLTSEQRQDSQNKAAAAVILSAAYLKYLAMPPDPKFVARLSGWGKVPQTNAEIIAAALIQKAVAGEAIAAREIRAATEPAKMELTGANGGPVEIRDIESVRVARWAQIAPMLAAAAADPDENPSPNAQGAESATDE